MEKAQTINQLKLISAYNCLFDSSKVKIKERKCDTLELMDEQGKSCKLISNNYTTLIGVELDTENGDKLEYNLSDNTLCSANKRLKGKSIAHLKYIAILNRLFYDIEIKEYNWLLNGIDLTDKDDNTLSLYEENGEMLLRTCVNYGEGTTVYKVTDNGITLLS